MIDERFRAPLEELRARRAKAHGEGGWAPGQLTPVGAKQEATTRSDVDLLNSVFMSLPEDVRWFIRLRSSVWSEFTDGTRCPVCGHTRRQAEALNYNCAEEC